MNFTLDGFLDPHTDDGWTRTRALSSAFLEQLLVEPYVAAIGRHGINLRGAWLPDAVEIDEATIPFSLRCQDCRIAAVRAHNAVIDGDFDLGGSRIEEDVTLSGADISGDIDMSNGTSVTGLLDATRVKAGGDLRLDDASEFTDIALSGAEIRGDVNAKHRTVVTGTLAAPRAIVGGDLRLDGGSKFDDIALSGADIGGDLTTGGGGIVRGLLNAERLHVVGSVSLRHEATLNRIEMSDASIGGDLWLHHDAEAASVVADDATIGDNLMLGREPQLRRVSLSGADVRGQLSLTAATWAPRAELDLRDAHVGVLSTGVGRHYDDGLPRRLMVDGLTLDRWAGQEPGDLGAAWFIDGWLDRVDGFRPGAYNDLAEVIEASGYPTIASDIIYTRNDLERLQVSGFNLERWGREAHRIVLGYGLRPWWAAAWLVGFWVFGFFVVWFSRPSRNGPRNFSRQEWWEAARYSLDRLLPAVDVTTSGAKKPQLTWRREVLMWIQQVAGWTLTLFIVGWLGSLIVQA